MAKREIHERTHPKPKKPTLNAYDGTYHMPNGDRFFADWSKVSGVNNMLAKKSKNDFKTQKDVLNEVSEMESAQEADSRARELSNAEVEEQQRV